MAREEIARLFAASDDIASRTMLMTVYAAGLRVSEVCHLRVSDIDSHLDRMCLRIEQGKGAMDRYTLLSPSLLVVLRQYWRARQPGGGCSRVETKAARAPSSGRSVPTAGHTLGPD